MPLYFYVSYAVSISRFVLTSVIFIFVSFVSASFQLFIVIFHEERVILKEPIQLVLYKEWQFMMNPIFYSQFIIR